VKELESISSAVIASLEPTLPTFENVIGHPVPTFFTYIVAQHECDHDVVWKRVTVAAVCEECGDWMPDYILECRNSPTMKFSLKYLTKCQ
jgi:hypothetical protein